MRLHKYLRLLLADKPYVRFSCVGGVKFNDAT